MNIAHILSDRARERGDAPAIIEARGGRDRAVSFCDLESANARFAERLWRGGIRPGDAILVFHPMSAELYAFLIACFRIGAVSMFVDPSAGTDFIERCLRECPPKAFFGSAKAHLLRLKISALRRIGLSICTRTLPGSMHLRLNADGPEHDAMFAAEAASPALITFTSGSTGMPKGALRTHGFLVAQHRALATCLRHQAGSFDLTTLPVFVLANLASGITSVLPDADMRYPGSIDPRAVLRQLQRQPVATMAASPAFVSRLTDECRRRNLRINSIRRIHMGGAPVFPEDLFRAREVFPHAEIVAVYGSTEAEPMAEISLESISADDFKAMAQGQGVLAGPPVASIALRILKDQWGTPIAPLNTEQFQQLCLGAEEIGEIVVTGEHVLRGYLTGSDDAENKFRVEDAVWHRTGDLGWLDRQGRLWLMGRASAAIRDERGVVYPFAVECAARQIPGVRRAAILAIQGKRILAVESDSRISGDSIRAQWEWAKIDEVRIVPAMPMDKRHNAKIDYAALRRQLERLNSRR